MSYWGAIFYPFRLIASPFYYLLPSWGSSSASASAAAAAASGNECADVPDMAQKIYGIYKRLEELKPQPGQSFDKAKVLEVLITTQNLTTQPFFDTRANLTRLMPIIRELDERIETSMLDRVKKIFDAAIVLPTLHKLEQANAAIRSQIMQQDMVKSIVWVEHDMVDDGLRMQRCTLDVRRGEPYYSPQESLTEVKIIEFTAAGFPTSASSLPEYLSILDNQPVLIENLDYAVLSDLFDGPDLNVPSTVEVDTGGKLALMRHQAVLDMPRVHAFSINGKKLFDKTIGVTLPDDGTPSGVSKHIFLLCMAHLDNHDALVNNISKLVTQASWARPCMVMMTRYQKPELGIYLRNDINLSIEITAIPCSEQNPNPSIHIRLNNTIAIMHIGDEPKTIRYAKAVRQFIIPRLSLEAGTVRGGALVDTYSRFYPTLKEAQQKNWGNPNFAELSRL